MHIFRAIRNARVVSGIVVAMLPIAMIAAAARAADEFAPNDISIGEPLQLPFERKDAAADAPPRQTLPQPPSGGQKPAAPTRPSQPLPQAPRPAADQAAAAAGNGWLGLTVDDSLVTGRLVVVEVAPQGPAAVAGVVPRDTLLAINGVALRSADELAAALAAISPGMDVKMAVGKGDRVDEITVKAAARPRDPVAPAWQAATEPPRPAPPAALAPPVAAAAPPERFTPPATLTPRSPAEPLPAPALSPPAAAVAAADAAPKGRTALGVRTVPVDSAMQARFQLPEQTGAFVIGVVHDLPASKAGVPPGSVIVALGNQPVRDPADLTRLVTQGPVGAPVPIQFVLPGGEARRADVTLQPLAVPLERALVPAGP